MAMMYPDVSPTAPVSREDLAAILALQGMNAGDAAQAGFGPGQGSQSMSDMLGGTPGFQGRGDFNGAPPANSNPDDSAAMNQGDMVTADASMVGEDSMGGGKASTVSGFGRTGDDTSQQSQDKQSSDRAAIAEAVAARGGVDVTDPAGMPSAGFVGSGYNAFAGAVPGAPGAPGAPAQPGSNFAGRFGAVNDFPDSFSDRWGGMPTGTPLAVTVTPNTVLPEQVVTAPALPTGRAPVSTGRAPGAPPGAPDVVAPGYDLGSPAPGGTDFGPGAYGGFTSGSGNTAGFGAGYSGSADMGNTQGAAGFTAGAPGGGFDVGAGSFSGGGAVGGFGGADAGPGGDGAGGGLGGGGGGNDSGSDGASGGVG